MLFYVGVSQKKLKKRCNNHLICVNYKKGALGLQPGPGWLNELGSWIT